MNSAIKEKIFNFLYCLVWPDINKTQRFIAIIATQRSQ